MPNRKKVLVTGLSGVVGSAMRAELEERYEVSSLSRFGVDDMPSERNFLGDIKDLDAIQPAFDGQDTVIHLAADRSAVADFASALPNNIIGAYNVFEAGRRAGVKRVIFGSSQHAVGGFYLDPPYCHIMASEFDKVSRPYPLLDETVPIRPSGHYGISKAYAEALGSYYHDYFGVPSIHVRIGFTISTDDWTWSGAAAALWLSHRDTAQIFVKAVDAPEWVRYTVVYAMSDNYWAIFSLDKARRVLGYEPQDGAGETITPAPSPERDKTEYKMHP